MSTQTTSHPSSTSSSAPPPNQQAAPAPPAYTPLPSPVDWADMQSRQLSNLAAGKGADELGLKGPEGAPAEYPKALYNKKTRQTKAAKSKDDEDKLTSEGFSTDPLPPEPLGLTPDEINAMKQLFQKAVDALDKLNQAAQSSASSAPPATGMGSTSTAPPAAPPKK